MITAEERVLDRITRLQEELVSLAKDLISVPTPDPPGENYDQCVNVIADYLKAIGATVKIFKWAPRSLPVAAQSAKDVNRPNVFAEIKGEKDRPVLHFNGHYDVVPASGGWSFNPYKPMIKGSKLYGRGSVDMKGAIAAMLVAAKAVVSEKVPFDGTWSFSFVPDEEMDGEGGTKFLVEEKKLKADYCIVGEPSGRTSLFNGHLGCLWLEVKTLGKAAHASAPWAGINAFEKMVHFVNAIERQIKPGLEQKRKIGGPCGSIALGGKVETGDAPNSIPASCTMTIDRRLAPGEDVKKVFSGFSEILKKLEEEDPDFKAEAKILSSYDPCLTSVESALVKTVADAVRNTSGESPRVTLMMAGCDMRYFRQQGMDTIVYGPGELSSAHQTDEHVAIEDLVLAAKVYALSAMKLLGKT
jgi:succinyl-diaminopimelate desuccinylase